MRYFFVDGSYTPKHCIYGPRPREAVLLNDREWCEIMENLHRNDMEKEMAQMYSAKERNKKEMSFNMTKNWQNTLASIKTQSEQRRIEKRKKEKQDKIDQYNEILRNKREERKPILENAKKMLLESRDATRTLTSAMVHCSVLAEREKQIEFRNFLREEEERKNALYAESIAKDVKDFEREEQQEQLKMSEMKKKFRNDLSKQVEERRKRIEEAASREGKATADDLIKMRETLEKLEKCQKQEKLSDIKRTRMSYEKGYHAAELEKSRSIEEDEENEVNRMIRGYAKRFERERAQKEGSLIEEGVKNRERIAESLSKKLHGKRCEEEEVEVEGKHEEAAREMEEENERMEKKKEELRSEREAEVKKWEGEHKARVAAHIRARGESLKWTILQNERKKEIDRAWNEEREKRAMESKANTRDRYAKQMKEREESAEKNRDRDSAFVPKRDEEMDDVLEYCQNALEYVKGREWKNFPLLSAIAKMKKDRGTASETGGRKFAESEDIRGNNKCTETEIQSKRPLGSFGYDCYCFRN